MAQGFPHVRSMIAVWSRRTTQGGTTETVRYFISSLTPSERTAQGMLKLIRGHWGGVENRNHWSRDAIWREDATRSRNPNLVGNLALLRNALLSIVAEERDPYGSLPAFTEAMQQNQARPFNLITRKLGG